MHTIAAAYSSRIMYVCVYIVRVASYLSPKNFTNNGNWHRKQNRINKRNVLYTIAFVHRMPISQLFYHISFFLLNEGFSWYVLLHKYQISM